MSGCVVFVREDVKGAPNLHKLTRKYEEALPDKGMYRVNGDFF